MNITPRGMYFEEFEVGLEIETAARTITETDIVSFAGLSGDFNFIHTNAEAAKPAAEKLISEDKVSAIIGSSSSGVIVPVAEAVTSPKSVLMKKLKEEKGFSISP